MKLLFFDDFRLGVLNGETVIDVQDTVRDIPHCEPQQLIAGLIERFAEYRPRLEQAASSGQHTVAERISFNENLNRT